MILRIVFVIALRISRGFLFLGVGGEEANVGVGTRFARRSLLILGNLMIGSATLWKSIGLSKESKSPSLNHNCMASYII